MATWRKKQTSIFSATLLLLLASVTPRLIAASATPPPLLAQSARPGSFPSPIAVPRGTTVRIDGSSSMEKVNQALRKNFEENFPGTNVELNARGSDAAIKALLDGKIDLAALGRPLTPEEKALGLVEVPLSRHKIAIIAAPDNPFQGDLTFDKFAKIFRGEITNWSQIGGERRPVQLIDRPSESDTRRAFQSYKAFQNAPFQTGENAKQIDADSTEEVIKELGKNGISYAIADQVIDRTDVRIIPMHGVFPDNPKYPFSQPLSYVYKKQNRTREASIFLGYASAPPTQAIIEQAVGTETAAPDAVAEPDPAPAAPSQVSEKTVTSERKFSPWWLLLLGIPLLGALLWWLMKHRKAPKKSFVGVIPAAAGVARAAGGAAGGAVAAGAAAAAGPAAAPPPPSNITYLFLVPYDGRNAYAHWQIAPAQMEVLQRQGGQKLILRLYDVTGIPDSERHKLQNLQQFGCELQQQYSILTLPAENRDYIVELGYINPSGNWLPLICSGTVRVAGSALTAGTPGPTVTAVGNSGSEATWAVQTAGAAGSPAPALLGSRLFLVAYEGRNACVYWQIAPAEMAAFQPQRGEKLVLRLCDATGIPDSERHSLSSQQEFSCNLQQQYLLLTLPAENRDYTVELGYFTASGNWLALIRSEAVRVAASAATAGAITPGSQNSSQTTWLMETSATASSTVIALLSSRLFLVPYDGRNAYVYWQIAPAEMAAFQPQGGEKLVLRLYDVTGIPDTERHKLSSAQQFDCDGTQPYLLLTLPAENRDYAVELGYFTESGNWVALMASEAVRVAASAPSAGAVTGGSQNGSQATWLIQTSATAPSTVMAVGSSRLFLVPYDGRNAYVYWQIAPAEMEALQRQGGQKLVLRLYDVTGIPDTERHKLSSAQQLDCDGTQPYSLLTLPAENRDYAVELGYFTESGNWVALMGSEAVRVVASALTAGAVTTNGKNGSQATLLVQTSSTAASPAPAPPSSRLFLVPYEGRNAYVYWQIAPAEMEAVQRQGGEKLMLRLYDVTGISDTERYRLRSLQQFDCVSQQTYLLLSLPAENRDYMVELGYFTQLGDWMSLIWSERVHYQLHHN